MNGMNSLLKMQGTDRIMVKSYIRKLIRLVEMEREAEINAMMNEIRRLSPGSAKG